MDLSNLGAVLYGRVSEATDRSVDSQLDVGRRWAQRQGVTVVAEHRDDGISASRYARGKKRPGWEETVDLVTSRQVGLLWVFELSRASRHRVVAAKLITACQDAHVLIAVDDRVFDPNDPEDAHALDMASANATLESGKTSKRVRRSVEDRAARGKPHGKITYGYRSLYEGEGRQRRLARRVVDPVKGPIVQEIVRRVLAGESTYTVARDLNARGVPTPRGGQLWRGNVLAPLIRNPAYAARRILHGKDVGPADWPALVTEADHLQLVEMFADPSRAKYRQDTRVKHLGTGLYRCGVEGCDGRMRVITPDRKPRKHGRRTPRYTCRVCFGVSRTQVPVDDLVNATMWQWLSTPDALALVTDTGDAGVQEALAEVARLELKLREARKAWEDDLLSLGAYADMEARILPRIAAAKDLARPRTAPRALLDLVGSGDRAERAWFALPITERRLCVSWGLDVVILPAKPTHTFNPETVRITPRRPR